MLEGTYYSRNRAAVLARQREYQSKNREKILAYQRNYYQENKDAVNIKHRTHYEENKDTTQAQHKVWRQSDKGRVLVNIAAQRRRARANGLPHTLTEYEWLKLLEMYDHRCVYCNKRHNKLEQEHIVPVIRGGGYTADNIVPACPQCNRKKGSDSLILFLYKEVHDEWTTSKDTAQAGT